MQMEPKTLRVHKCNKYVEMRYIKVAPGVVIRGLFARRDIPKGTKIEEAPVVPIYKSELDSGKADAQALDNYTYDWQTFKKDARGHERIVTVTALCLGLGGIFNGCSEEEENVEYVRHYLQFFMEFFAKRDIKKGEELLHDYQWPKNDSRYKLLDPYMRPVTPRQIEKMEAAGDEHWTNPNAAEELFGWDEFLNYPRG